MAAALEERQRTGRLAGARLTGVRKSGERFPVQVDSVVLPVEPSQTFVLMRDVTKASQYIDALRESEERFRSLFESMEEGVVLRELILRRGRRRRLSRPRCQSGVRAPDGMRPDLRWRATRRPLYGTGKAPYLLETRASAESGEPYSFETYFAPMERHFQIAVVSPAKGHFATVFEDITQRKRAEDLLRLLGESRDAVPGAAGPGRSRREARNCRSRPRSSASPMTCCLTSKTVAHESGLRSRLVRNGDALHSTLHVEDVMGLALQEALSAMGLDAAAVRRTR